MISNLDDLKYEGGYPTVETIQELYDQLDLQRACAGLSRFHARDVDAGFPGRAPTGLRGQRNRRHDGLRRAGRGQVDRDRPDLQHGEHLRQPQPRPEADGPGRHRGAAEGPGHHQRRVHALRGGPGQRRPRPWPGRQVPAPAAGLRGRRARRLLRLPVEHLPELGDGPRLRADHRAGRCRAGVLQGAFQGPSAGRGRAPAGRLSARRSERATRPIRAMSATSSG